MNYLFRFLFLVILLALPETAFAADLDVVCSGPDNNNGQCTTSGSLFNVQNFVPNETVSKTIQITNTHATNSCLLKVYTSNVNQTPDNLATQFYTSIDADGVQLVGDQANGTAINAASMQNVLSSSNTSPIFLLTIDRNQTRNLNWIVTFNENAGNPWQNGRTVFDFNLNFECDGPSSPGPTPSTDDDNDDDDDDDDDDNDDDDNGNGDSTTTTAGIVSGIARGIGGIIRGITTTQPQASTTQPPATTQPQSQGQVEAATDGESGEMPCVDVWWWWVFLLAQALMAVLYVVVITRENLKSRTRFYSGAVIIHSASVVIYYLYFCPWWDYILAILIGVASIAAIYLRFRQLETESKKQDNLNKIHFFK